MARIRTVKPEFAHDRDLARVSRDARLTFVLLWTIADDEGFFRAEAKYLVGVLFPLDPDVTEKVLRGWLKELTRIGVIAWKRLTDGTAVGYVVNWKRHQRIDHPSRSFLRENLASDARGSREDVSSGVLSPESRVSSPESQEPSSADADGKALVRMPPAALEAVRRTSARRAGKEQALGLAVDVVFGYWQAVMRHDGARLDRKRAAKLTERLRENGGDVSELLDAVDGALRDDYIMGRDPKAPRKYDGIETLFRDRAQVERFVALARVKREPGAYHPYLEQLQPNDRASA